MYAVVKTGGKQYRITAGETIQVEKLEGNPGDQVVLDQVLLVGAGEDLSLGRPVLDGARVLAEIAGQGRHRKVTIYKYRRRKRYHKKAGHRQCYTALRITSIEKGESHGA
jgi:large subunit ribosomal protein L21